MGMVSCWWAGWNEKSLLSPWKQNIFLWIFWLFGLFCQANEKRLWGPLISGPPEDAFKFLFLFPSWFLTNASRRSLSGPRDSSGWSITCRTSASQKIIHEWEGWGKENRPWAMRNCELGEGDLMDGFLLKFLGQSQASSGCACPLMFYSKYIKIHLHKSLQHSQIIWSLQLRKIQRLCLKAPRGVLRQFLQNKQRGLLS